MKKNGFVSMTMVYTFLILFLFLMLAVLMAYAQQNRYLEAIDSKIDLKIDTKTDSEYCPYSRGQTFSYTFTGEERVFVTECSGKYKIELWGAGGSTRSSNSDNAGKGSYTAGTINLAKDIALHIYVGEKSDYTSGNCYSSNPNAAYNGQTSGTCTSGGGATDIRLVGGNWNNPKSLRSRIMVAAGGGGAAYETGTGGSGGGLNGYTATGPSGGTAGNGGTQVSSSFGVGGIATSSGGGGYYGGAGGSASNGGGGSSYISGHTGCIAIASNQTTSPRKDINGNTCSTGTTDVVCSHHYSNYVFTNTVMVDGKGYSWSSVIGSKTNMPSPTGSGNIEGNTGNGYAKITFISE